MTKLTERAGLTVLQLQEVGLPGLGEVPQGAFPAGLFSLGLFPAGLFPREFPAGLFLTEFFAEVESAGRVIHLLFSFYMLFYLFPCAPALPIFIIFGGMK